VLAWNQRKVRQLTPTEIWLFIIGRVLAAFGLGIVAVERFPDLFRPLGWPAIIVGVLLLLVAGRGMTRSAREDGSRPAV
jgi:hypothetical protein